MNNKIIGIKQADGSFFPILNDGEPTTKKLVLTTAEDGQTTVKVNLYKKEDDSPELEYVDTLLIEDLVPHLKQEASLNLSINLDEENMLTAEVRDPETGAKSDTRVSLVTLSEAQLNDKADFTLSEASLDDIAEIPLTDFDDIEEIVNFDNTEILPSTEDREHFSSISGLDDIFNLDTVELTAVDDDEGADIPFSNDDDEEFQFPEPPNIEDDFDISLTETDVERPALIDDTDDKEGTYRFDENTEGDDGFGSYDDFSTDDSMNEISLDDDFNPEKGPEEFSLTEDFEDFNFSEEDKSDLSEISFDDDFERDIRLDSLEKNTDSFNLDDVQFDNDFAGDFDLDIDEDNSEEEQEYIIKKDSNVDVSFDDESTFPTEPETNIEYRDFDEEGFNQTASSFVPPLYDEKLQEDIARHHTRKKHPLSTIICVICAIICIIAVILSFTLVSWPSERPQGDNIVSVEPPQVFVKETQKNDDAEKKIVSPVVTENTIKQIPEVSVKPKKPEPSSSISAEILIYRLVWGDTLWDLSDTFYRNPWLYNTIADANNIANPDHIIAGTDINIPLK